MMIPRLKFRKNIKYLILPMALLKTSYLQCNIFSSCFTDFRLQTFQDSMLPNTYSDVYCYTQTFVFKAVNIKVGTGKN